MKPLQTYFPFGPPIGCAELPKELINDFNKSCDDIVKDEELAKSEDWSHNLVGQVEQEIKIPVPILDRWGNWFAIQVNEYLTGYFNKLYVPGQTIFSADRNTTSLAISKMQIEVISAWYVRSFAGDYNPIHTHSNCHLTCVGYLKVPDLSKERKKGGSNRVQKKYSPAGNLEVLGNNSQGPWEHNRLALMPEIGNWYLFPANIRHAVYPFRNDGERRSFSINFDTRLPWDNPPNFNKE